MELLSDSSCARIRHISLWSIRSGWSFHFNQAARKCGLTIHSSRRRFTARLNSSVRPLMKIGIAEAFRRYGATLKNVNWSVSSWADENTLVVSLWDHHHLKGDRKSVV